MLAIVTVSLSEKNTHEISIEEFVVDDTIAAISGIIALLAFSQVFKKYSKVLKYNVLFGLPKSESFSLRKYITFFVFQNINHKS